MQRRSLQFTSGLLLILLLVAVHIGCSAMSSSAQRRVLQSMTITPSNAQAQNFPQGQVQFTATGMFSQAPSPATVPFVVPYSGTWSTSHSNIATINQTGLAECVPGASGTVTVEAIASTNSANGTQMSTAVSATAKLSCP